MEDHDSASSSMTHKEPINPAVDHVHHGFINKSIDNEVIRSIEHYSERVFSGLMEKFLDD